VRKLALDFEDYDYDDLFMTPEEVEKTIDNGQFSELWTLFLREFPSANKYASRINHFLSGLKETYTTEALA